MNTPDCACRTCRLERENNTLRALLEKTHPKLTKLYEVLEGRRSLTFLGDTGVEFHKGVDATFGELRRMFEVAP